MIPRRWYVLVLVLGSTASLAGCQTWCKKKCGPPPSPPCPSGVPAPALTAPPAQPVLPATPPGPIGVPGQPPPPPSFPSTPSPAAPGNLRYYGPGSIPVPPVNGWQPLDRKQVPAGPSVGLEQPAPSAWLEAPLPGVTEDRPPSPVLPVGIPQFNQVLARVSSGLKPDREGLDWLRAQNYQAVLSVRSSLEDDTAERSEVERRGLKFGSIAVSPQTLSRKTVADFSRQVTDPANHPLFVYDRDGSLAGSLWYLHFRLTEKLADDEARSRAARLGLKSDTTGDFKEMWLAIQKVLAEQP